MIVQKTYHVVLFQSVNQTMWADKILREIKFQHKLVPVPRHISSDCGVCLRISSDQVKEVREALTGVEGFIEIVPL